MQIRHARHGDEAQLAFLLEDHERHYDNPVADGSGAKGASFLVEPPPGGTLCLVAEQDGGRLVGFAIRPSRHAAREEGLLRDGYMIR